MKKGGNFIFVSYVYDTKWVSKRFCPQFHIVFFHLLKKVFDNSSKNVYKSKPNTKTVISMG